MITFMVLNAGSDGRFKGVPPRWLQAANTGLFVVYIDTRGLYELFDRPQRTDRSVVVKFSR
ncbi:MAG: hypothetical protein ACRDFW_10185, partial [bacterium]